MQQTRNAAGLYRPEFERDSCGFGLIAQMDNRPSHWLVQTSIDALARLTHRGAIAADGKSGDGCGLLMRKPDAFLRQAAAGAGIKLSEHYGVGMVFLNRDPAMADAARAELQAELERQGLTVRLISYKGLVMPANLPVFYPDLGDERLESSICLFHQRFSTNTLPQWPLAQPFRYPGAQRRNQHHRGNRNWAEARSHGLPRRCCPTWPNPAAGQRCRLGLQSWTTCWKLLVMPAAWICSAPCAC
jgi:glutamate synthase domain-containing protein 1